MLKSHASLRTIVYLVSLVCVTFSSNAFATAQYPDKIIYKGKEHSLHSNPMEVYFAKHPEKKPRSEIISSALWRGYVATFEIADGSLLLKDVEIEVTNPDREHDFIFKSVIEQIVPAGERLKIDWFNGLLVLPEGKIVNYVHMGYGSTYERYTLLAVEKGVFKSERNFGYKEYEAFKQRQFEAFKKTDEYKELIDKMKKDGDYDPKFADDFLRSFITNYTSNFLVD